tara:strand:- start:40 stop:564 length:525 start_codon:yes stop_codon:yes gene_type:complete
MKKMILLTSALVGFTFAQTGMMTAAGESGMGVWLNHGVYQLDNDDYEGTWTVGFDYMTGVGVEVGLNMGDGWKGLDLGYHHKMEKCNVAVSWSRQMWDDLDVDMDNLWVKAYCDSALYGGLGGWNLDGAGWEFENLTVGKIWTFDMGMSVGVSYNATFDTMGEGELKLDLGYTF